MNNPLDQFLITKLIPISVFGIDISFTNSALFMVIATVLLILFQHFALRNATIVPGKLQLLMEYSYNFIKNMVDDNIGDRGKRYVPIIFTMFMFLLFANLLGMLPYGFTTTSHVAVTFIFAGSIFIAITAIGFMKHGFKYCKLFFPEGAPLIFAPILIPLEILAYLVRPITLSLRLFLNMTAGHIMLKVFAGFSVMLGAGFAFLPALFNVVLIGFEFFVACLQAYIFTILICIYLNDALNLH